MLAPFFLGLLVAAGSPEPAATSPRDVRIRADPETLKCNYNRVMPSADGDHVVAWRTEEDLMQPVVPHWPGDFVVASGVRAAFDNRDRARLRSFAALGRLEPVRWAPGGARLHVRLGDDSSFDLDAATGSMQPGPMLDERWRNVRMKATSYGDLSPITDARGTRAIDRVFRGGQPLRIIATVDSSVRFLTLPKLTGFKISVSANAAPLPRPERAFFLRDASVSASGGSIDYLGKQPAGQPLLPYARALFDLDSGR